ncbi:hypothetical protein DFQ01_105160 [Paenibacillus cellulosilyticus]|uniref:Uncharacterized protein n=1 Tax=Paenibacillus cellulosilyticus TaxID=375489 RepID=A0A2V2YWP2_9BACL|nr:hypothetical protein DFQ01_105160 [Paenibacillus cellulosilyticus]
MVTNNKDLHVPSVSGIGRSFVVLPVDRLCMT